MAMIWRVAICLFGLLICVGLVCMGATTWLVNATVTAKIVFYTAFSALVLVFLLDCTRSICQHCCNGARVTWIQQPIEENRPVEDDLPQVVYERTAFDEAIYNDEVYYFDPHSSAVGPLLVVESPVSPDMLLSK